MALLFISELNTYMSPNISEELFVDTSRGHKLRINLDVVMPTISCNCKYIVLVLFFCRVKTIRFFVAE